MYNLSTDPGETINLALSEPEIVDFLDEHFGEWLTAVQNNESPPPPIQETRVKSWRLY